VEVHEALARPYTSAVASLSLAQMVRDSAVRAADIRPSVYTLIGSQFKLVSSGNADTAEVLVGIFFSPRRS
jgi:hypothetical protein